MTNIPILQPHQSTRVLTTLALVSTSLLNFEMLLTRIIAIEHWHHLASVVIAIALLGFGIAGSLASVFSRYIAAHYQLMLNCSVIFLILSYPVSLILASTVPFNMLALPWHWQQYIYLFLYGLCWLLPFLFGGFFITLCFMRWSRSLSALYSADLLGAAVGALLLILVLENGDISLAQWVSPVLALMALALFTEKIILRIIALLLVLGSGYFALEKPITLISPNQFKELAVRSHQADAKLIWQKDSNHSQLTLVDTEGQHAAPGLSINSSAEIPNQWQLFIDGDNAWPMMLNAAEAKYQDVFSESIYAAPYLLTEKSPSVLLLGGNQSWNAWTGFWHDANKLMLINSDSNLLNLLAGKQPEIDYLGFLPEQIRLEANHPRRFIESTADKFDLIMTSVGSNLVGSAAEEINYMMTRQGIDKMLEQLSDAGILSISNIMAPVPRDNLRLLNTVIRSLDSLGLKTSQHLLIIRDWRTMLFMVSKKPFTRMQLDKLTNWCQIWSFDMVAAPGLVAEQTNLYHSKTDQLFYTASQQLLSDNNQSFTKDYLFDLSVTEDNKPYFFHGFRWQKLLQLKNALPGQWPIYVGWGYLLSIASLALLTCTALIFIIAPLRLIKTENKVSGPVFAPLLYFTSLGIGFMCVEIALLHRTILILDSATLAFATVITAMLVGAGLGSRFLGKLTVSPNHLVAIIVASICWLLVGYISLSGLFHLTLDWPQIDRVLLVALVLACLAFPLGMFLPYGLNRIKHQNLIAWCWGTNGFASVSGVLLAPLIAMEMGLMALLYWAFICYLLAAIAIKRI